jgi:hypothetical protein
LDGSDRQKIRKPATETSQGFFSMYNSITYGEGLPGSRSYFWMLIAAVICITGCETQLPSKKQTTEAFTRNLPEHWAVGSFRIERFTRSDPTNDERYQARYFAELVLAETTYVADGTLTDGLQFVRLVGSTGQIKRVAGQAIISANGDDWDYDFGLFKGSFETQGVPLGNFSSRVIVRGSAEEKRYLKEMRDRTNLALNSSGQTLRQLLNRRISGYSRDPYNPRTPVIVVIQSYSGETLSVRGQIEWPALGSIKAVSGELNGTYLRLAETGWIARPADTTRVLFGSTYYLLLEGNGIRRGLWEHRLNSGLLQFKVRE